MQTHLDQWWGPYLFGLAVWWYLLHSGLAWQWPAASAGGLPTPFLATSAAGLATVSAERTVPADRARDEIIQWLRQLAY